MIMFNIRFIFFWLGLFILIFLTHDTYNGTPTLTKQGGDCTSNQLTVPLVGYIFGYLPTLYF